MSLAQRTKAAAEPKIAPRRPRLVVREASIDYLFQLVLQLFAVHVRPRVEFGRQRRSPWPRACRDYRLLEGAVQHDALSNREEIRHQHACVFMRVAQQTRE